VTDNIGYSMHVMGQKKPKREVENVELKMVNDE
jgi:hypothetical protein